MKSSLRLPTVILFCAPLFCQSLLQDAVDIDIELLAEESDVSGTYARHSRSAEDYEGYLYGHHPGHHHSGHHGHNHHGFDKGLHASSGFQHPAGLSHFNHPHHKFHPHHLHSQGCQHPLGFDYQQSRDFHPPHPPFHPYPGFPHASHESSASESVLPQKPAIIIVQPTTPSLQAILTSRTRTTTEYDNVVTPSSSSTSTLPPPPLSMTSSSSLHSDSDSSTAVWPSMPRTATTTTTSPEVSSTASENPTFDIDLRFGRE